VPLTFITGINVDFANGKLVGEKEGANVGWVGACVGATDGEQEGK